MKYKVVIIDYGMGNINSIKHKLRRINVDAFASSSIKEIEAADKIILPGVGNFKKAIENLESLKLIDTLNEEVLIKKKPILGICLGMQLFANYSEEGNAKGLGWLNAKVVKFNVHNTIKYKVPHTGWNNISIKKESPLMIGIQQGSSFYFIHSYHYITNDKSIVLSETEYDYKFISAVEQDNIFGVQYHPEKSHDEGERILTNFIQL